MELVADQGTYTIHLPQFEGPFDLLLFFIERDELDIHDIPISKITKDFLDYLHHYDSMNIEVASEFILVASTLMRIKAKMLLPRPQLDEDGNVEDPRSELVNRLLEYKRYKETLEEFQLKEAQSAEHFKRGFVKQEEKMLMEGPNPEEELVGMDLYTIMRAFQRLWERHKDRLERPRHVIRRYPYTTDQVKGRIIEVLSKREKVDFVSFILDYPDRIYCVFTFLSVLELTQVGKIRLVVGKGFNNFWMARAEDNQAA